MTQGRQLIAHLRRSALQPEDRSWSVSAWVDGHKAAFHAARRYGWPYSDQPQELRRMFLLFVAEAIDTLGG